MNKQVAITMIAEFDTADWEDLEEAVEEAFTAIRREFHRSSHKQSVVALPIYSADNQLAGRAAIAITEVNK